MKNRGFKVILLSILFIIPLMLVTIKPVYSSPNPPPGGFHWMGPAVIADLTFMRAVQTVIKYEESLGGVSPYKKATVILLFILPKGK